MGYVYLAGVVDGCHKIGCSQTPIARVRAVGNELKTNVSVVAVISATNRRWLERYLHTAFADRRVRGEWFRLTRVDVGMICQMSAVKGIEDIPRRLVSRHDANAQAAAEQTATKKAAAAGLRVVFEAVDEPTRRAIYFAAARRGVSHGTILNELIQKHLRDEINLVTSFMAKDSDN